MYVVSQLKDGIAGLLTGMEISEVPNIDSAIERASRMMAQKIAIPESMGRQNYLIYNGVYDYPAPLTIFGGSFLDFRPQGVSRTVFDEALKIPIETFDINKTIVCDGTELTFEYRDGVGIMRAVSQRPATALVIDNMAVTTGWVAGGSASGLAEDDQVFYKSPSALRFTLTGNSTGYLEKTLTNSINLSTYQGVAMVFLAIRTPIASNLTNINLRLGSSSANYVSIDQTTGFVGAWVANNYLLVGFDLSVLTATVGSPNFSAINYVRVTFTHTATLTNFRVGYLSTAIGSPFELLFKSAAIFSHNGVRSSQITDDNDTILLNDAAYTILEHEGAIAAYMNSGGTIANPQITSLGTALNGARTRTGQVIQLGLYDLYKAANPSEEIRTVGNWYD